MKHTSKFIFLALILLLGLSQNSYAVLQGVGSTDGKTGFPTWYSDGEYKLDLCLDGDPADSPCFFDPVDPLNPWSVRTGFGGEAFWFMAESAIDANTHPGTGIEAILVLAVEAAYANEIPVNGDQVTFARLRIRVDGITEPGVYVVNHPYGKRSTNVTVTGKGREINYTQDVGIAEDGNFTGALKGVIGPYLKWPEAPITFPQFPGVQFIGDVRVPHVVTGSPIGQNYFEIIPPANVDIGAGPGVALRNELFTVAGRLSTRVGVKVDRATYTRDAAGEGFVEVFATSDAAQVLPITVDGVGAQVEMTELPGGKFFARIPFTGVVPASISVTNQNDIPLTPVVRNLKDLLIVDYSLYDTASKFLSVSAYSSDMQVPTSGLTVTGFSGLFNTNIAVPPPSVTVRSTGGGSHVESTTVIGPQVPDARF